MESDDIKMYAGVSMFILILWWVIAAFTSMITSAILVAIMCILFTIRYRYEFRHDRAYKRRLKMEAAGALGQSQAEYTGEDGYTYKRISEYELNGLLYLGAEANAYIDSLRYKTREELEDVAIYLLREPDNAYDQWAVKVLNSEGLQVGYVQREVSERISQLINEGKYLEARFTVVTYSDIKMRIFHFYSDGNDDELDELMDYDRIAELEQKYLEKQRIKAELEQQQIKKKRAEARRAQRIKKQESVGSELEAETLHVETNHVKSKSAVISTPTQSDFAVSTPTESTLAVLTTTFEINPPVNEAYNGSIDYVVIDCESATSEQYICAISIVGILNNSIIYTKYWLIQPPENKFSRINSSIHGIKSIDTIDSPRFIDVYEELKHHLTYKNVVAHNYSADRAMLNKTCDFYKLPRILIAHWCCTYRIYGKSLKDCASIHNIALDHHNAISDAEACAQLFILHKKNGGDDWPKVTARKPLNSSGYVTVYRVTETAENENNFFYDKKIAVTGNFDSISSDELLERIYNLGGTIRKTVTDNVDLIVMGDDPSSKILAGIEKVQDQGVVIPQINEIGILNLLQGCEQN